MKRPMSLRRRVTFAVLGYAVLLSVGVGVHGYIVNERAEAVVWESMLRSELAHFNERRALDPDYRWANTTALLLFDGESKDVPRELLELPSGLHDEIGMRDGQYVAYVSGTGTDRKILALDISRMEREEQHLIWGMVFSSALVVAIMAMISNYGIGRLIMPLTSMARSITGLDPNRGGQRVAVESVAPQEALVVATALNDYLARIDQFVERERAFLNMASHELRTPIAVIAGTAEVALDRTPLSEWHARQFQHVLRTARDMEELVALLLTLAKDPARLASSNSTLDLGPIVHAVVDDHRVLARDKELTFEVRTPGSCEIRAPQQIVRAAVGNLVRNAIENSDRGVIEISMSSSREIVIADPGHGMNAEELNRIHTRVARAGGGIGGGIGIELIARVCQQLGWELSLGSQPGKGTEARLKFTHPRTH